MVVEWQTKAQFQGVYVFSAKRSSPKSATECRRVEFESRSSRWFQRFGLSCLVWLRVQGFGFYLEGGLSK